MNNERLVETIRGSPLFDGEWYTNTYKDVLMLGMDPAEHYLKYGALLRRDPGPSFCTAFYSDVRSGKIGERINPLIDILLNGSHETMSVNRVLLAANSVAASGRYDLAMRLAKKHLPSALHYTTEILSANEAHRIRDETLWLHHLNSYLGTFGLSPVELGDGGHLISKLRCTLVSPVHHGPLVSVIMAAWNSENTVEAAAHSILKQTWQNLELLIVDDASKDQTWNAIERIRASDSRVKIFRNARNVGPYVSKNLVLQHAKGAWITGQDADDWSHPQRIEDHLRAVVADSNRPASITHMVRVTPAGEFSHIRPITTFSFDGVATKASVSCMYEREFLFERLGHWDSVRFGADSEMISRASTLLGEEVHSYRLVNMLCCDIPTSLTNDPVTGVRPGVMSPVRAAYRASYTEWHASGFQPGGSYLPFPHSERRYDADPCMIVPVDDCRTLLDGHHGHDFGSALDLRSGN